MNLQQQFQQIRKTAITIGYSPAEKTVPTGQSKFGGQPHLPADFKWPYYESCARVFYVEDAHDLQQIDFPEDMDEDFIMPEFGLSFESKMDLPDYEEIAEYTAGLDGDSYDEERARYGYEEPDEEGVCKRWDMRI